MKIISLILFVLGWSTISLPTNASVTATLSKAQTGIDDPVRLTIVSDQNLGVQSIDTRALDQDFTIVGQSSSSVVSMGSGSSLTQVQIFLDLVAKREGTLTIPSLSLGGEQTTPLELTVVPARDQLPAGDAGPPSVMIESVWERPADADKAYVQGQLNFGVRIYHQGNLLEASLDEPKVKDVLITRLGDDVQSTGNKNGTQYQIIERRYALFPQKSGRLTVPPVTLQARILASGQLQNQRRSFSPFSRGQRTSLRSKPLRIDVLPPESTFTGPSWIPSTSVTLSRSGLPTSAINAGDAINMQIELSADGLMGAQLPEIEILDTDGQFKIYPDQAAFSNTSNGKIVMGKRIQTFVLIPSKAGQLSIPQIRLAWWDTKNAQQQFATLPAVTLEVVAINGQTDAPAEKEEIASPFAPSADAQPSDKPQAIGGVSPVWKWISLISLPGWLLSLVYLIAYRRKSKANILASDGEKPKTDLKALINNIKDAANNNQAEITWQCLQDYARARWPDAPPNTPLEWSIKLSNTSSSKVLTELENHLFRDAENTAWSGKFVLTDLLARLNQANANKVDSNSQALPQMYPRR